MEDFEIKVEPRDNSLRERLEAKIKVLSSDVWQDKWEEGDPLNKWISNFEQSAEINALYLLSHFMYFNNKTIRELLQRIYQDLYKRPLIFNIRRSKNNIIDEGIINAEYKKILDSTRFLGLGNPSESGVHMLYYFRQENPELKKNHFINAHEIFDYQYKNDAITVDISTSKINRLVFIDDFCGSGDQASEYYTKFVDVIKSKEPSIHVSYYSLFATSAGLERVNKLGYDNVKTIYELDESFKCFTEKSRYFKFADELGISQSQCKLICEHYGNNISSNALGHGDCQLLLGFHHNTPNNTLPIFWSEKNNWNPIFKRYQKNY